MFRGHSTICLWLAAFLFLSTTAFAAPPWIDRTWQSDEGLPDNSVIGVGQTPDGYLWVCTSTGLSRFDGVQFVSFPVVAAGVSVSGNTHFLVDRRGRLWVAKKQGDVVCIEKGRASKVVIPDQVKTDLGVMFMMEDAEGSLWITFGSDAVVRIQEGHVRSFTEADGFPPLDDCQLVVDGVGQLWFRTLDWIGIFQEGRFKPLHQTKVLRIAGARSGGVWGYELKQLSKFEADGSTTKTPIDFYGPRLSAFHEDRQGTLWLGTREKGLFMCDRTGVTAVTLEQQAIQNIQEDREGNIWVGTRGGLSQLKPRVAELLTNGGGVPFTGVSSIALDIEGHLWAIRWPDGEVVRSKGQDWSPLTPEEGWPVDRAKCIAADPRGGVWIGTRRYGLYRWQAGAVTESFCVTNGWGVNRVHALCVTASGAVWFGTGLLHTKQQFIQCLEAGKLRSFNLPLGWGPVIALTTDAAGDCWGATERGLLLRVHGDRVTDETARTLSDPSEIRCLFGTPDGSLWIGYGGQGLGRLKAGSFTRCGMEHGLRDNYISNILPDQSGRLWLAGNRGIFSVREKELCDFMDGRSAGVWCATLGRKEGLARLQASYDSWPGALSTADGRLMFAMQSGVAIVYPADILSTQEPPPVVIERVSVNGQTAAAYGAFKPADSKGVPLRELSLSGGQLRLPPGRHQITFAFTALSLSMPENIGFRYQLQGVDADWVAAGSRRQASYTQLQPGHYRFKVTACDRDGIWNETGATVELTAEPYWWETAWFRIAGPICGFGVVGCLVVVWLRRRHRHRIERLELQQATEKERTRIAQDLHDDLGAELSTIAMLSDLAQQDLGENHSVRTRLGEIIGHAHQTILRLEEIVWAVNPANDTVERFSVYVCKCAQRYLELANVRSRFDLPVRFQPCILGSVQRHNIFLATKEALHNAVRHGKPATVTLRIALESGWLQVTVEDDGVGFEDTPEVLATHGSSNMRSRMSHINGTFERRSSPGQGTTVRLSIPVEEKKS